MTDAIYTNGVRYISTASASADAALTAAYISLLCRHQKVRGTLAGGKWYVDPESLQEFLAEQARLKAQRQASLSAELRAVAKDTRQRRKGSTQLLQWLVAGATTVILFGILSLAASTLTPRSTEPANAPSTNQLASAISAVPAGNAGQAVTATSSESQTPSPTSSDLALSATPGQSANSDDFMSHELASAITDMPVPNNLYPTAVSVLRDPSPQFDATTFVTQDELSARLLQLSNSLAQKFEASTSSVPENVAAGGSVFSYSAPVVPAVNNLSNVIITNPTVTGGSIPASSITGTLTNAINATLSTIDSLTGADLRYTSASTTDFSNNGTAYFGGTATSTFDSAGNLTVAGNTTLQDATATTFFATTASSTNLSTQTASVGVLSAGTLNLASLGMFAGGFVSQASSTVTGNFTVGGTQTSLLHASTTELTNAGATYLTGLTNAVLSTDAAGQVTATTSIGINYLSGTLPVGNGGTGSTTPTGILKGNGAGALLSAVGGTDYEFPMTFSAPLTRSINTISIPQATGSQNGYLASADWTAFNNKVASTSLSEGTGISYNSGTGVITNTGVTSLSGTTNQITASGSTGAVMLSLPNLVLFPSAASSTLFSNFGTAYFGSTATSSFNSAGQLTLANLASAVLGVNASGQVVATSTINWNLLKGPASSIFAFDASGNPTATTSIGTSYLTGSLGTVNGTALPAGSSITVTAASSTLLANNNTFSGNDIFSAPLQLTSTTGTTTIASGQGFTVGGSQFVVQQGSGDVGVGTTTPASLLALASSAANQNTTLTIDNSAVPGGYNAQIVLINSARTWRINGAGAASGLDSSGMFDIYDATAPAHRFDIDHAGDVGLGGSINSGSLTGATMVVDSNGNVGIGTTSPQALLGLQGSIGVNSSQLYLAANGTVSIGTTSPTTVLDLWGSNASTYAANSFAASVTGNGNGSGSRLVNANTTANNGVGLIFSGVDTGGNTVNAAGITGVFTSHTAGAVSSDIVFQNRNAGMIGETMRITSSGNVGIGTTTPLSNFLLDVNGTIGSLSNTNNAEAYLSSGPGYGILQAGNAINSLTNPLALNPNGGNVGIGTTSPSQNLSVAGNGYFTGFVGIGTNAQLNNAALTAINAANGAAIETTGSTGQNAVVGDATNAAAQGGIFHNLASGNFCYIGSGTGSSGGNTAINCNGPAQGTTAWTNTSDARLKTNVAGLPEADGLAAIEQLQPITFNWLDAKQNAEYGPQLGFLAQDVQKLFPSFVADSGATTTITTASGTTKEIPNTLSLSYASFVVPLVEAVQQIASISDEFEQNLIAWLGNAQNGIGDLFAENGHFSNELCVGSTCVTPAQFQAMVAAAGHTALPEQASTDTTTTDSDATNTPPQIQINGDNPAIIQVDAAYQDLGATIEGPPQDLNLGIETFLNGTLTSNIVIDTSETATDTIDYVATDQNGLTSTSTRTVVIESAQVPSIVPSGNASSTAPTTTATTTSG